MNVNFNTAGFLFSATLHWENWALLKAVSPWKFPFPLFLMLFGNIIIPTGICITSKWQPKRWYHCYWKTIVLVSPCDSSCTVLATMNGKKPWRLLTASSGACCKQTASGMHNNVMTQERLLRSEYKYRIGPNDSGPMRHQCFCDLKSTLPALAASTV